VQDRLLKTDIAEFARAAWSGRNESGFAPMSTNIMVLPDGVNDRTAGGIFLPEEQRSRMALAAESGVVVAMGSEAFKYAVDGTPWRGDRPSVGAHVYFERYAGQVLSGRDGLQYRVMDAKCVGALALGEGAANDEEELRRFQQKTQHQRQAETVPAQQGAA